MKRAIHTRKDEKSGRVAVMLRGGYRDLPRAIEQLNLDPSKLRQPHNELKGENGILYCFFSELDPQLDDKLRGQVFKYFINI